MWALDPDRNLLDGKSSPYSLDKPIPLAYLKTILEYIIPKNLNKSQNIIFEKKKNDILTAYAYYLVNTCNYDIETGYDGYPKKWASFQNLMKTWEYIPYNYSLHL